MLKKLLKYDIRYVWKLWVALSIAVLGMSLITSLLIRANIELALVDTSSISYVFSTLGGVFSGIIMVLSWCAMLLAVPLMCYIRYYQNFFSDEGYLTFTLPVRRKTLYLSKVINVFIFSVANMVITLLAVLIMMLIIPTTDNGNIINFVAFKELGEFLAGTWEFLHGWTLVYALGALLLLAAVTLYQVGMIHLCITVGATVAKKHKVAAGVGIYFGAHFAISTVQQLLGVFSTEGVLGFFVLMGGKSELMCHVILTLVILLVALAVTAVATILHLLALHSIERKLNLA